MEVTEGYVYQYIHKTTGKWYIGSHNGKNKNYSGSGLIWRRAKRKYGIDAFDKQILYIGPDFRKIEEQILTNLDAANHPLSYNKKNEALGGSFPGELNGMYGKKLDEEARYKCGNAFRGKLRPSHSIKMSGSNNPTFGKNDHAYGLVEHAKRCKGKTFEDIHVEDVGKVMRAKISASHTGLKHNLKEVICPHCLKTGRGPNMTRYHFNKCKKLRG